MKKKFRIETVLHWLVLFTLLSGCHGGDESMHHLVLLDQLPYQFNLQSSPQLIVRTNFSGFVDFKESDDFKVLLNVSAPSIEEAYAVTADVTESKGRLLIQVYENKLLLTPVTLPWIFIFITIATCIVAILASAYAIWWYCSKQYLGLQRDFYSHGNVMFRSRNSECLSTVTSGAGEFLLHSDHGRESMADDGKDLPDLSEEDEDENGMPIKSRKKHVHNDESDEDNEKVDEKLTIKRRYQAPSKRLYREQHMRRHGRRKRHPSLNDPPSYDAVMEYPNDDSDDSDGEDTQNKKPYGDSVQSMVERGKKPKAYVESSRSFGEQNTQHYRDLYTYNPLALQTLPVAHSDGELNVNVRSPRYVVHNIPPRGFVNPMERHDDYNENKDGKFEKIMNSKESLVHAERSKSPVSRDEGQQTMPVPRGEVQSPVRLERSSSIRSDYSRASVRSDQSKTAKSAERSKSPIYQDRSKTPNHYERGKSPIYEERSRTPSHYERGKSTAYGERSRTPSHYERGKSPATVERSKTPNHYEKFNSVNVNRAKSPNQIYARAIKPVPPVTPPELHITEQNNLDDSPEYIQLKTSAGPPIQKLSPLEQVDSDKTNPMDIPLTTFTGSLKKVRHKSKPDPVESSPKRAVLEGYNYNKGSPKTEQLNITGTSTINSQRFSVLSDNSISLYSSGEIYSPSADKYDADDDPFDFDVEIPPLEPDDDGLSEASLPLPSPPAYAKIPGYSPGISLPSPKPRPPPLSALSGLSIPVDEDMMSGTYIGLTASPSNTLDRIFQFPSPYRDSGISSERSLPLSQGDESPYYQKPASPLKPIHPAKRELPPPPPRVYCPPQRLSWDTEGQSPDKGEYAKIKPVEETSANGEQKEQKPTRNGRGGGKKPALKPKQLHLAVICSLSILSLATTVYSALPTSQTQVHVTVYAPKNFFQQGIEVYFNQDRPADLLDPLKSDIQAYDMADPFLTNLNSSLCDSVQCEHGCDENDGNCICKKGYRLDKNGICQDVNECRSINHRCHENADCLDKEGTYQCHCSGSYYGDGKTCFDCDAPCMAGTYEIQPCGINQKKICSECTKQCDKGYYMQMKCSAKGDAICRMCLKKCDITEYEYRRCTDEVDRECKERKHLNFPSVSNNVILENLKERVIHDNVEELVYFHDPHTDYNRTRVFRIDRGSGFYIKGSVSYFRPQITLKPVHHSDNNDLADFNGSPDIVNTYCPYPVPSHYELVSFKLQNITYRNSQYGYNGKIFIEPCNTYKRHGLFPDDKQASRSILCSEPGPVTNIFDLKSGFSTSTPHWVETTADCVSRNAACLNCTKTCAKRMRLQGGDCVVTDKDNGRSPRLPLCMSCCSEEDCTELCRYFHDLQCQTEKCFIGDLRAFQLRPVFDKENIFCHMRPLTNEVVMKMKYEVMNYYETLDSRRLVIKSDGSWITTGKMHAGDNIVDIDIDSKVSQIPDLIKMSTMSKTVEAGLYKKGDVSVKTLITQASALVRPTTPFITTAKSFAKHSCEDEVLDNLMMARGLDEPLEKYPGVVEFHDNNYTYAMMSQGPSDLSNARIMIQRHKSLLESLFSLAKLDFNHLQGNITHNSTHWLMNVKGSIEKCPGVLSINLTDPAYPNDPLFQFFIKVRCPKTFELTFAVPTGDKPHLDKEYAVSVRDIDAIHQIFVFKPAARKVFKQGVSTSFSVTSKDPKKPAQFSIPFTSAVIGCVMLLLFIAAFGMMVKFGQPTSDVLHFHWRHLVLMVGYISFHFLFAVCASMTVFVLVVIAVNGDTTAFLKNYQYQRSVKSAFTHLELDHMERHLQTEIQRQNSVANASKLECDRQMMIIIENLNELKKEFENQVKDEIEKKSIHKLMTNQMKSLSEKFTVNIGIFKERFDNYIKFMRQKFTSELKQTYKSIEENKWLQVAQFLRRSVKNVRDLENLPTRPFLEWIGIPKDLTQLSLDKPIPVPTFPTFDDVFQPTSMPDLSNPVQKIPTTDRPNQYHNFWSHPNIMTINQTETGSDSHKEEVREEYGGYTIFFILMVIIDLVWLLHRMSKAVGVCSLLLYGYPIYVDIRDKTDNTQENEDERNRKQRKWFKSGFVNGFKKFLVKMLVSMFIPKMIATIFVCLFVYMLSMASFHFINRETFSYLGYYNNMDDLLKLNEKFINRRLETHASRINLMQYPAYQELSNLYLQRHLFLYKSTENHLKDMHDRHSAFYCNYLKTLNVSATCESSVTSKVPEVIVSACQFEKISPHHYLRHTTSETNISDLQMDEFLFSIRKLIEDTCYIVLIFMSVIIVKELLGTVIWLYMKRSGFINLRIIFEADEPPNGPHK